MLVNLSQILKPAQEKRYAAGLFNVVTLEQAEGVIQAAEALRAPLIIGVAERFLKHVRLEALAAVLLDHARRTDLPVAVHFDHGCTFEGCMRAMRLGFSSVMYDCSEMPYEENVRCMAEVVRAAHAMGVTVEGELGCVEGSEDGDETHSPRALLTDPEKAFDFVNRTGVDALAVSVGNAHGAYKLPPKLDFELIETIRSKVEVPLVLHGGSGLTDLDFQKAISCGIAKINIFTETNQAQTAACRSALENGAKNAMEMIVPQVKAVREAAEEKMRLFGCINRY